MAFLYKEMCFRDENELTQFISQYDVKLADDKSAIDCKASQMAITQQKLLQQMSLWENSLPVPSLGAILHRNAI